MANNIDDLTQAVINHSSLTIEEIKEVRNAQDGYSGFTYYDDTESFYDQNEHLIWLQLSELADGLGETPLEVIAGFGGAKDVYSLRTFKNLMAWYALEEVASHLQAEEE